MLRLIYKSDKEEFETGDLVLVKRKDPFSDEETTYQGRILKSVLSNELELDISERYKANKVSIILDEIVNINKVY